MSDYLLRGNNGRYIKKTIYSLKYPVDIFHHDYINMNDVDS